MTYQPTDRPGPREVLLPTSAPISERLLMQWKDKRTADDGGDRRCPKLISIIYLFMQYFSC